jgi:repressor LexA
MNTERATKKQQALLQFVDGFIREHGYGPSYREIMTALGYKSVSTVAIHINGLIAKGYLNRRDNSPRSLEVTTISSSGVAKPAAESTVVSEITAKLKQELSEEHRSTLLAALELLGYGEAKAKLENKDEALDS